jgi:Domain of unknown function (DUF6894)
MVRFFFHIKNDSTFEEEEEGENYPNLETTRAHAAKIASEQFDKPEPPKAVGVSPLKQVAKCSQRSRIIFRQSPVRCKAASVGGLAYATV